MKTRGDSLFILMSQPPRRCSHITVAEQPSRSAEGLSLHTAGVPTHALFLAGVEGAFLSPETLWPLLALPADSITEQFLGRGIQTAGEKHCMLSSSSSSSHAKKY